jgi:hypothetical protein
MAELHRPEKGYSFFSKKNEERREMEQKYSFVPCQSIRQSRAIGWIPSSASSAFTTEKTTRQGTIVKTSAGISSSD